MARHGIRSGQDVLLALALAPKYAGRASAGLALGRSNYEAGAGKMHTDLADGGIVASDDDLMDARGDQFADDGVAAGIIRRDGDDLAWLPADGVSRIGGRAGD